VESVRLLAVNAAGDVLGYDDEAGRRVKGAAAHDTMVAGLKDGESLRDRRMWQGFSKDSTARTSRAPARLSMVVGFLHDALDDRVQ
jgi:hypothetical protein